MKRENIHRNAERGATLVEATVGVPLLMIITFLFVAFGHYAYVSIAITDAIDVAAREALSSFSRGLSNSQIESNTNQALLTRLSKFGIAGHGAVDPIVHTSELSTVQVSTNGETELRIEAEVYAHVFLKPMRILETDRRGLGKITRTISVPL